jgi:hypothetical protein
MEKTIKKITYKNAIEISKHITDIEEIEGVHISLESSTASARIFNIALKLATMDWQEPIIDRIEEMLDSRLLEIANGDYFIIECQKINGHHWTGGIIAKDEESARKLYEDNYKNSKILSITKKVQEKS